MGHREKNVDVSRSHQMIGRGRDAARSLSRKSYDGWVGVGSVVRIERRVLRLTNTIDDYSEYG